VSETEARRQQQLLAALSRRGEPPALREPGSRAERGLAAYRANASALAERALAAACPTVQAMMGEDDFAALARAFWRDHPPQRGDLGEWGGELPGWIATQPGLAEWPWLADSAGLDLAVHGCERAADAVPDLATLALLGEADPADIELQLMPGMVVLVSSFPIATIHAAHRSQAPEAFAPVRAALAAGQGEAVCVSREGWRAVVHGLAAGEAVFMLALLRGASLAAELEEADEDVDFGAWLQRAITLSWLKGVARRIDSAVSHPTEPSP
jgi:hypothetical protein